MSSISFLMFLLVAAAVAPARAQITVDVTFHAWQDIYSSVEPSQCAGQCVTSLQFCLQPLQPPPLSTNSCQHGMYQVPMDDSWTNNDSITIDIPMIFYSPGSLDTKLQLLVTAFTANWVIVDQVLPLLDASNSSTIQLTVTDTPPLGTVSLSYRKSFSDCIDDSGLGADLSSSLQSSVGLLATLLAVCLILCLLLVLVVVVACKQQLCGAVLLREKECRAMDIELSSVDEGKSLACNYERHPDTMMGSMLSVASATYSYPHVDINVEPPSQSKDQKPPLPKRSAPISEVADDTPAPAAGADMLPVTGKQKKKEKKEKKGKKMIMRQAVQKRTRYDSNPAYMATGDQTL